MSTPRISVAALIVVLAPLCRAAEQPVTHRYTIITSANDGDSGMQTPEVSGDDTAAHVDAQVAQARERHWFRPTVSLGPILVLGNYGAGFSSTELVLAHPLGNDYTVKLGLYTEISRGFLPTQTTPIRLAFERNWTLMQWKENRLCIYAGLGRYIEPHSDGESFIPIGIKLQRERLVFETGANLDPIGALFLFVTMGYEFQLSK
jgi:hypothetical protein